IGLILYLGIQHSQSVLRSSCLILHPKPESQILVYLFSLDYISLQYNLNFGAWSHHLKRFTENLRFRIISNDSESQTAISGLGRRVGQLDRRTD
ncbi:hypothetical protein BB560_004178, partial [Smittium megazygosporum]